MRSLRPILASQKLQSKTINKVPNNDLYIDLYAKVKRIYNNLMIINENQELNHDFLIDFLLKITNLT